MTDKSDLLLDLNFVPAWARKTPSQGVQAETYEQERENRPSDRRNRGNRERRENRRAGPPRHARAAPDGRQTDTDPAPPSGERKPSRAQPEPLPLKISFIPERHGLKPLIARLARTGLAYPLLELAAMFLSKPNIMPSNLNRLRRKTVGPHGVVAMFDLLCCVHGAKQGCHPCHPRAP